MELKQLLDGKTIIKNIVGNNGKAIQNQFIIS